MKFIAFYLPQYHTIPENDNWWGKGFTEWVRVSKSVPLFEGHYQPRIPLEYYDLSNTQTMIRQAALAKKYGLYGFCYYHYWFKGKKLLEKPLDNMLECKDVDIPFCLSWANESWTRAWDGNSKEVLIEQEYGNEADWEEHINYLIPFFKDSRYIFIHGLPVLLIYKTRGYSKFDEMIAFWNQKIKQHGFSSIYIIETLNSYQRKPTCANSCAILEFEPMFTIAPSLPRVKGLYNKLTALFSQKKYRLFCYDDVWKKILKRKRKIRRKEIYLGAFVDWDNTPRFKNRSTIFTSVSPTKFYYYLCRQIQRAKTEFIFINAWNEWAEGAYLEPDHRNGYAYLEAVKKASE